MRSRMIVLFSLSVLLFVTPGTARAYDWAPWEGMNVNMRGDLTYGLKVRTEHPYPRFVTPGSTFFVSGNENFEKWDLTNNGVIGTVEVIAETTYFSLFGRTKALYDAVYDDKDRYNQETREHAAYNFTDALEYYLEGKFDRLTFRLGRQIVQWGESIAPVYAPGVNVINQFFAQKVASAGYTFRDWQVPSHILWTSYEVKKNWSLELVYAPDFDPRFFFPVVGTFASPVDVLGFGSESDLVDELRPKKFEDQQQYGGAFRVVIPSLNMFELGFYYFHHLARFPVMTMQETFPPKLRVEYPELDMVGMSFSQTIQALDLNLQLGGELAYRPNDTLQKDSINSPFLGQVTGLRIMEGAGGWERGQTLTWVIGGMRFFFDVLSFTPYTFTLTPLFEFYGKINLEYSEPELFSDPQYTAYYNIDFPLTTSDMIDNTALTLEFQSMGGMHKEMNKVHHLIFTTKAKYGDSWEILVGYDFVVGNVKQDPAGLWMWDRNALTFKLTYHFI